VIATEPPIIGKVVRFRQGHARPAREVGTGCCG
jgi:hypothetical protein